MIACELGARSGRSSSSPAHAVVPRASQQATRVPARPSLRLVKPYPSLRSDAEQRRKVSFELRFGSFFAHAPELGSEAQRVSHVRRFVVTLAIGSEIWAVGLEQQLLARQRRQHAREALGAARIGRNGQPVPSVGDRACELELAAEAVPIDSFGAHLQQDLEGTALSL